MDVTLCTLITELWVSVTITTRTLAIARITKEAIIATTMRFLLLSFLALSSSSCCCCCCCWLLPAPCLAEQLLGVKLTLLKSGGTRYTSEGLREALLLGPWTLDLLTLLLPVADIVLLMEAALRSILYLSMDLVLEICLATLGEYFICLRSSLDTEAGHMWCCSLEEDPSLSLSLSR